MDTIATRYKEQILQTKGEFFSDAGLPYGGTYIPEVLLPGLQEIAAAFDHFKFDEDFLSEFHSTYTLFRVGLRHLALCRV